MEIRLVKKGFRFYFRLACQLKRVQNVTGVNSQIDPDTHFLMWDFDDVPLPVVKKSLRWVQETFNLPNIIILRTKQNGYHGYCFKACSFLEARGIIAFTPNVDKHYIALGIGRGYFTLRFTDVKGREFQKVCTLRSDVPDDLTYKDVNCFVQYTKALK